jgi:hypothetical protein
MNRAEQSPLSRFNNYDKEFWHKKSDQLTALGLITLASITWLSGNQTLEAVGIGSGIIAISSPITFAFARAGVAQAGWIRNQNKIPFSLK